MTFGGFPGKDRDAGYLLLCKKEFTKIRKDSIRNAEILTPEMVMDSLTKNGRPFLRKNIFYVLFIKGENYYIHRVKRSEYLYKNYKDE
jgi:hypothetical protein